MLKLLFVSILVLFSYVYVSASHNLAGQITYKYLAPNTYEITLTTYTDPFARGVDRCNATIEVWGKQGNNYTHFDDIKDIPRENGPSGSDCASPAKMGTFIRPGIKKNIYRTVYTFNGPGLFQLRYFDVARVNDVINMANSGATAFYVATELNNIPFIGINNSPVLLNDPLDDACTNRLWTHNPGAFDADGDSLSFALINCQQYDPPGLGSPISVANYQLPGAFGGSFTIDAETGLVTWNAAQQVGVYNISIEVTEWRDGRKIGTVIRDMAIFVKSCINNPPIIEALNDTCIRPNNRLTFPVTVTDPDIGDSVYFYLNNAGGSNNGPFLANPNPAVFIPPISNFPLKGFSPQNGYFQWDVLCEHIKPGFYQVDFYAHDNIGKNPPLAANHITKIRVIPGPVQNLTVTPGSRKFILQWTAHECTNATGYEIYRSAQSSGSNSDSVCCTTPMTSQGYTKIATVEGRENTHYMDSVETFQNQYCYRVVTLFEKVRSCPSNEVCLPIKQDFPLITQDSIGITGGNNGTLLVSWANPTELDTLFYPRPFFYKLLRGEGLTPGTFNDIATLPFTQTEYIDNNLNTVDKAWSYKLDLYDANQQKITYSNQASSVYLTIQPADQVLFLHWAYRVPWVQDSVQIFRSDTLQGTYHYVATVSGNVLVYEDIGLENGNDYCYFVRTFGHYETSGIKRPLINDSQKNCAIPIDLTPPCLPAKESIVLNADCENFQILLTWNVPDSACGGDIDFYTIWKSEQTGGPYQPIFQTTAKNDTNYIYQSNSIKGCFVLTATDTVGNVSPYSAEFCTDNCPYIIFPNVFTPNNDGINDFFSPIEYRSIESIEVSIYDRWGVLIHTAKGLSHLWDGKRNGKEVPEGVYFYQATITLQTLQQKTVKRTGNISLFR